MKKKSPLLPDKLSDAAFADEPEWFLVLMDEKIYDFLNLSKFKNLLAQVGKYKNNFSLILIKNLH
ncbi:MAG: hypothetical protein Kow0049_05530 [Stanieria sp.]